MFLYTRKRLLNNSKRAIKSTDKGFLTIGNLTIFVFLLILPISTFSILRIVLPMFNSYPSTNVETSYHPTSIPWIEDSARCENSGRTWDGNKCWDFEHSPLF
ncbi:hypothetical protein [Sphaerospermopsis aphanizomenoides]|uniref:hypothetical protein n=1 Tax=Sphaerospermopsis aphanizomenoides TaxID=459663 RepID=UPI0019044E75|nr:hypothetical protein [Sphaerospermopsis aphanizomenoides]